IQTIILFGGLNIMGYNEQITNNSINEPTKTAIGIICFGVPAILVTISLIVFSTKFKLYGDLADKVHAFVLEKRSKEEK
ncbi:MAG: hypothetical protein PUE08_04780, partial [Eubacteriales bacterium]|nr:hypothetical protein [Eubacteriales bacterium]